MVVKRMLGTEAKSMKLNQLGGLALGLLLLTTTTAQAQTVTCETFGNSIECWEGNRYNFSNFATEFSKRLEEGKAEARRQDEARRQQEIHDATMWNLQLQNQALMDAIQKTKPAPAAPAYTPPPGPASGDTTYTGWNTPMTRTTSGFKSYHPLDTPPTDVSPVALTAAQIVAAERAAIRKRLGLAPITD